MSEEDKYGVEMGDPSSTAPIDVILVLVGIALMAYSCSGW